MKQGILATVIGRAVADPDLRFSAAGKGVGKVRVAATERKRNDDGTWEDGESVFLDVVAFGADAERLADSIFKGDQIVATGRLKTREFQKRDGTTGFGVEIVADGFGVIAKNAPKKRVEDDPWTTPAQESAPF